MGGRAAKRQPHFSSSAKAQLVVAPIFIHSACTASCAVQARGTLTDTRSRLGPEHIAALPQFVLADLTAGVALRERPLR